MICYLFPSVLDTKKSGKVTGRGVGRKPTANVGRSVTHKGCEYCIPLPPRHRRLRGRGAGAAPGSHRSSPSSRDGPGRVEPPSSAAAPGRRGRGDSARRPRSGMCPLASAAGDGGVAAARGMRALGPLLALCLVAVPGGIACPRLCACYGPAEMHCTFRYFTAVPPRIPPGVQRINLGYNSLLKLTDTDFSGLEKLELLMLHSNEINTIPEKVFRDLYSLQVLKLSYNKVRVLEQDAFYGLKSLVRLHMDHNKIEFVNPNVFYGLTSLRLVHLEGNLLQQLHPDTFVTLRYSQIFKTSFLKHIYLSDNGLTSLPQEMLSYMSELESIYLHGNPWSCDCSLQWFAEWAKERPDVIKCKKDRSSGAQQCPICASPKNHNGKSLVDIPSASLTCTKPAIHDSLKLRNLTVPDDGDFSSLSPKDFIAPLGSVVLNMTDKAGNRGDLVCNIQKPKETFPVSFDKDGNSTVLRTSFSAFLVCGVDYEHIQQLWSILALYSDSPLKLERNVLATDMPFVSYKYKQVYSEKDELFTNVEAELRAQPAWLMQSRVALRLDRTATTLSSLHIQYSTDAHITLPSADFKPQVRSKWAIISRDNKTQREHTVTVGGSIELECQAAGEPAPAVEWVLADGSRVRAPHISEDGRILVLQSGTFTLRTADAFDSGLYHCVGTNDEDADSLTFRITVVDPDVARSTVNGAQLAAFAGSTLDLPCSSTAAPDAAISWVLPDQVVLQQSAGNKRVFDNGTLRIQGVTEQDSGYFRCVAANQYGVDLLVFQVLVGKDKTTPKIKPVAAGEWEEGDGSGNAMLASAATQKHPLAPPATSTAHQASAASAEKQVAQSVHRRNGSRKAMYRRLGDKRSRRFRGHRRQFASSARRVDPQHWAAFLEKAKRNSTSTEKQEAATTKPPIQVHKLSEVPGEKEEASGDLSPEEEFMIPVAESTSVSAAGRAMGRGITAGPERAAGSSPAWKASPLVAEAVTPLPSPFSQSMSAGSRRPQTYLQPAMTNSWERSDLSQPSANEINQPTLSNGGRATSPLFPAGQGLVYSGESDNQQLNSAATRLVADVTDTSMSAASQSTVDKLHVFNESLDEISTTTGHQVPVVTVSEPSPESGHIYFHSTQKQVTPKPPLASTTINHQQVQLTEDTTTRRPQAQQRYGGQRKSSGRRQIVRPGRFPSIKEHRYNFGRPGSVRGSTAADVQLNMRHVPHLPTLNNLSSSTSPFHPEAPLLPPSTMTLPSEHPVGMHANTAFPREEEGDPAARQKAATAVMPFTAEDTTTSATKEMDATSLKPTATPLTAPQTDAKVTKSKIFRVGKKRGQRRKRPPKTSTSGSVAAGHAAIFSGNVATTTQPSTLPPCLTPTEPVSESPPTGRGRATPTSTAFNAPPSTPTNASPSTHPDTPPSTPTNASPSTSTMFDTPQAPLWGGDKDSSAKGWAGKKQDQETPTTNPTALDSLGRNHFAKPRITGGRLAAFTVLADSDAFIPCEATGNPRPTIQWTKLSSGRGAAGGRGDGRWLVFANGTLSIARAALRDRGQYLCTAANAHGTARLLVTVAVVAYPPRIAGAPRQLLTAYSGQPVALRCKAEGRPPPTVSWVLANKAHISESSAGAKGVRVEPDGTLVIEAATVYDRGLYTCMAENPAGTARLEVTLQVIAAPPAILEEKRQRLEGMMGESLRLPCTAQGDPQPTVHWALSDGTVVKPLQLVHAKLFLFPNGTLQLSNAAPADSGTYECIATSSTGSERRVVSLVVQHRDTLPKITSASPQMTHMEFGDKLLLNCTASGEPEPRIIWRLPSKAVVDQWHRMGSRIHVYPNGSLVVEAVTEKDAGDYLCVARNTIGDDLILMKVGITMKPAKIDQKQDFKKLVPYGKDFQVDCKASGSPAPDISWSLPDGTVLNSVRLAGHSGHSTHRYVLFDNGTLYLNKAGVAEGGDYTCLAQNTLGRDEMKVHVTIIVAAPQIKHNHKAHVKVKAGDTALLDCEAVGEPKPKIFWLLPSSDVVLSSTARHILHVNGSLLVSRVRLLDAGEYMCVARNPGGDDTKLYKLDVIGKPPTINGFYGNKTIMKVTAVRHSKKQIDCRAEGSPPPQIMWIMPDNIFLTAPYYGSRITVHKNGTLEIRNIRPSDTADFTCVARNDGGESVLVVQLEVSEMLRRPTFKNPFNEKIIAKPGTATTLNCSVDGNPPPDVSWMLPNGTWFPSGINTSRFLTGSSGTLTIYGTDRDTAGKYRCAARNKVGYIEKLIILEVAQKPRILTHPTRLVKGTSGEPLSLHCLSDGSPRPHTAWTLPGGQVLERPQVGRRHTLLENGTLVIREASAQDRGSYVCRAHNAAGEATLTVPVAIAALAPRIAPRPPRAVRTAPGAAVWLHCAALGIPQPDITWQLPDRSVLSAGHRGRAAGSKLLQPLGTLLIQNPRPADSGAYKCTAKNHLGTDFTVTYVHVT
ncbi:immunoglobulin superfamily member 10 [Colius striatus]|uniref:immunoglobulin superfamily member 10 n=1 Tax=Colius striatus TaxID=57412 RepID=UPI002B1DB16D|nr:immunoglobulin superfamily member 10 [Colius striatus]